MYNVPVVGQYGKFHDMIEVSALWSRLTDNWSNNANVLQGPSERNW